MLAFLILTSVMTVSNHYVVVFAWQDGPEGVEPSPRLSHSFATWVKTEGQKIEEEFTISWMAPNGVRLIHPAEPGRNLSMKESLEEAKQEGLQVFAWGPYRVTSEAYERAKGIERSLEEAESNYSILYKAIDRNSRRFQPQPAINCIHAVTNVSRPDVITGDACGVEASLMIVGEFASNGIILGEDHTADWIRKALWGDYALTIGTAQLPATKPRPAAVSVRVGQ